MFRSARVRRTGRTEMTKLVPPATKSARHESDVFGYPNFMTVLAGQTVSVFGSQMAAFAISIWIYHETGSVIQFATVIAAQLLPVILLTPLAGVMIDRYRRKNVMLASEVALIAASLVIYALISAGALTPKTILVFAPLMALLGSVHQIAYASSIPLLVPRAAYGKANGFVQVGINGSAAVVPLIAVYALEILGLGAVILLNVATYVIAIVSLMFAKFMEMPSSGRKNTGSGLRNMLTQQSFGIRYIWSHSTLLVLIVFMCAVGFLNGLVLVLFRPMILSTESATVLGWLVTIAGVGARQESPHAVARFRHLGPEHGVLRIEHPSESDRRDGLRLFVLRALHSGVRADADADHHAHRHPGARLRVALGARRDRPHRCGHPLAAALRGIVRAMDARGGDARPGRRLSGRRQERGDAGGLHPGGPGHDHAVRTVLAGAAFPYAGPTDPEGRAAGHPCNLIAMKTSPLGLHRACPHRDAEHASRPARRVERRNALRFSGASDPAPAVKQRSTD
jgi:MFS family permease